MGPEILVTIAFVGGALTVVGSAYAGWATRGKVAAAITKVHEAAIASLTAQLERASQVAVDQREGNAAVLAAANRRAEHDPAGDPLGLGLLLGSNPANPSNAATPPPGPTVTPSGGSDPARGYEGGWDRANRLGRDAATEDPA